MFFRTFLIILYLFIRKWFKGKFFPMSIRTRNLLVSVLCGLSGLVFSQLVLNSCKSPSVLAILVATGLLILAFDINDR